MHILTLLLAAATSPSGLPAPSGPLLMRHPTINKTSIVFGFGGDLWSVPREGGLARRLTSAPGIEEDPYFSPDGKTIAFTARYDGNTDVFTVDSEGGIPKRLTYHPSGDLAAGWTPDGKSVVFSSNMQSNTDHPRLYSVPVTGGVPKALPFPSGTQVSYSPDGQRIAYMPGFKWQDAWKRYRGGQTSPIWVAQLSDSKVKEIPRKNTNDENPMWVGGKIFYTSDKQGPVGLYSYDVASGKVTEEVKPEGFDIKSASTGDGVIVYEKLGSIYEFNPATKVSRKVEIEIRGDFPEIRTQYKDLSSSIGNVSISPTGARVAVSARGWVLTVPASKGDARVLDETQGINRQAAAWSPDGKTVAYVKDDGTNHDLALFDLAEKKERIIAFPDKANYYGATGLHWSPDSKKIAVVDRKSQLTVVNLADGKGDVIDKATYTDPQLVIIPRWSPDSKWLTWARDLDSHMYAVFVHSFETGKNTQITDGLASANSPVFDRDGKHIYFTASTTVGLSASWLDMSSLTTPNVTSSVYAVVLKKDGKNPLEPESDEEKGKEPPKPVVAPPAGTPPAAPAEKKAESLIDLDGIESRIISLPLPTQIYGGLEAGPPGSFFALTSPPRANANSGGGLPTLIKFSFADRRAIPFASGVVGLDVTPDGTKALLQTAGGGLQIVSTMAPAPPGVGAVSLAGLTVKVDPKKEWRQMFDEIWKNEPIFFYSPTLHGIDAKAMHARYLPFVENLVSRADLNYLFSDMLGEICIGHMFISGGDIPGVGGVPGGLLGADYAFENGRYRLTKIYDGERWNPGLRAPLAQPGINAKVGEYVLAIDGKDLTDSNDIYEKLEAKAGKQVSVRLGPTPDGEDSREVTVVPVANEFALRSRAWAEDNRRAVEKGTNGRAGYVHIPDTGEGGWQSFNRYYYAQVGKDGMVIDERFNHGGQINDFMINEMQKTIHGVFAWRYGKDWPTPGAAIYGPKVMLINQFAGSGGDMFPWLFRHHKIGPLIGKRTWGGLVASFGFPILDGGVIRSPDGAFYDPFEGKWDVENHGVDPDIEVDMDPFLWRQGRDPQLERAIAEINKQLANWTPPKLKKPAFPIKSKVSDVDKRG